MSAQGGIRKPHDCVVMDDLVALGISEIDGPCMERYPARREDIANQLLTWSLKSLPLIQLSPTDIERGIRGEIIDAKRAHPCFRRHADLLRSLRSRGLGYVVDAACEGWLSYWLDTEEAPAKAS
jgi:hypothetical protein